MQSAPARKNKSAIRTQTRAESVHEVSPSVRRQLLTLAKVHGQSSDYYRATLMPVIRAAVARLEART